VRLLDWLIRLVRQRIKEMDREEAVKAARDEAELAVRQVCTLGDVPWLAEGFIRHRIGPSAVVQGLFAVMQRDPVVGRRALQGVEFVAPEESATIWDASDRKWLVEMERAFVKGLGEGVVSGRKR
jgi:hypothetical protein